MADKCLAALDVPVTAAGVGNLYGSRRSGGILDGWLVDPADAATKVNKVEVRATPLWMTDEKATAEMVSEALKLAGVR